MTETQSVNHGNIDENLYSRQLYVIGEGAMRQLAQSKVLISGIGGIGIEIAKNLVLAGIQKLIIQDNTPASYRDLSSQFFLNTETIGKNRADASLTSLRGLNPNVAIAVINKELKLDDLKDVKVFVLCNNESELDAEIWCKHCHSNGILFILPEARGFYFRVFCDFGDTFVVQDPTEIEPSPIPLTKIANDESGLVNCLVETTHGLQKGDQVKFTGVKGMETLNNLTVTRTVTEVISTDTFSIGNTSEFERIGLGGSVKKLTVPKVLSFDELSAAKINPKFATIDFFKNPLNAHLAFETLKKFIEVNNKVPAACNDADAEQFCSLASTVVDTFPGINNVDTNFLKTFSKTCQGSIGLVAAFLGGFVAQEVIKGCTGKFVPLHQWLIGDFVECIPNENVTSSSSLDSFNHKMKRYIGASSLIGEAVQNKLCNLRVFVVGAGAIGCEILKNLAIMGVGSGPDGKIIVTDNDSIEKSNLSRQFLFRANDIGKPKSVTAAKAIKFMNPDINIEALTVEVGLNDDVNGLDYEFFKSLDCVVNALDNVAARKHMDEKCVDFKIPLLESGTQGAKGSTQIVIPDITKCYRDSNDPPPTSIPMCTLKHFPYRVEHTIQWARDLFEEAFMSGPTVATRFIEDKGFDETKFEDDYIAKREALTNLKDFFVDKVPSNFEECVDWALVKYNCLFDYEISVIVEQFPEDLLNKSGQKFWSGSKKFPHAYPFRKEDELCFQFIYCAANLRASVFGIKPLKDDKVIDDMISRHKVKPKESVGRPKQLNLETFEGFEEPVDANEIEKLKDELPKITEELQKLSITAQTFEKDDDENLHVDFIVAASNLRATIYGIETADRMKTKKIAGKIIPAIATTTSVVAALVCLELYKLFDESTERKISRFRDSYVALAVPQILQFLPKQAKVNIDANGFKWSIWSTPEVQGDVTMKNFIETLHKKYKVEIVMVSYGDYLLYFDAYPDEGVLKKSVLSIIEGYTKVPLSKTCKEIKLQVLLSNHSDTASYFPPVRYLL